MLSKTNYKRAVDIVPNLNALTASKIAGLLLVTIAMTVSTPSFAEKAKNYGDINDEDGKYISWHKSADGDLIKTSHKSDSSVSKTAKVVSKKQSEYDFADNRQTGYGDLDQDED